MTLRINLRNLRSSASGTKSLPDLLIGITADLEVNADGLSIYEEPDFPVLELAYHLRKWVDVKPDQRADFNLDSMESSELGLVRILRTDGGWSIGSCHEQLKPPVKQLWEIDEAVTKFLEEVQRRCQDELKTDVREVLGCW
ncbi:hypothetical protein [Steroidobacter cummioxidans]|uniref:DUF7878 domain-containing protein n=1 Tax=Steroidobacter cummioxidans TaxID=1803913 RepID=UPI000E31A0C8|nr:hypothetical protein [Steroidobacter cummioxidans]